MEKPSYYSIITADVRYSELINANEKLLYAEITSLTHSSGVCWASNNYFSELYKVTPQAISKWIRNLSKNGFITLGYIYKEGSKEILKREIRCINTGFLGINTGLKGYQHTIKDNNTSINNIDNNIIVGFDKTNAIDFDALLVFFNKTTGKNLRLINPKTKAQFNARLKEGYTKEDIFKAIINCSRDPYHIENPKYLTPEFISRADKIEKYANATTRQSKLPDDWFSRELTTEQQSLLSPEQLKRWKENKVRLGVEGGYLKPIER